MSVLFTKLKHKIFLKCFVESVGRTQKLFKDRLPGLYIHKPGASTLDTRIDM